MEALLHDVMPYPDFISRFSMGDTSTEKSHDLTRNLSSVMTDDMKEGLSILSSIDVAMTEAFLSFIPTINELYTTTKQHVDLGGRIFFVGR